LRHHYLVFAPLFHSTFKVLTISIGNMVDS
jgi:hypothetical protein